MILTKEQVEKRLSSEDNIANQSHSSIIIKKEGNINGRGKGSKNLTEEEKIAIGVLANLEGNEVAAELMGVSEDTARHLRTAQTSIRSGDTVRASIDTSLKEKINERLDTTKLTIQERAAEKLLTSLGLLDQDKLANCSAKDLAGITNQMSQVVRNMSNRDGERNGGKAAVKIILHQPKPSREESFDFVEIGIGT